MLDRIKSKSPFVGPFTNSDHTKSKSLLINSGINSNSTKNKSFNNICYKNNGAKSKKVSSEEFERDNLENPK